MNATAAGSRVILPPLARRDPVAGALRLRTEGAGRRLRVIEWGTNLPARRLLMPYGDQAICQGPPGATWINQTVVLGYRPGVSPQRLAHRYRGS